jgi:sulfate adenylyltransferase
MIDSPAADLVPVHGGLSALVDRIVPLSRRARLLAEAETLPTLRVSRADLSTIYRIADGGLSPLVGPMREDVYHRVLDEKRILVGGKSYAWTIPLSLPVADDEAAKLGRGGAAAIRNDEGRVVAILDDVEVFAWDKHKYVRSVYGTERFDHPGGRMVENDVRTRLAGGELRVLPQPVHPEYGEYMLSPRMTRALIRDRKWERALAFQTRNPLHRAHEYALVAGAERLTEGGHFTGVVLNPLVGELKGDDVPAVVRMRAYRKLHDDRLLGQGDKDESLWKKVGWDLSEVFELIGLDIKMFYGGPSEAVMHSIYRQNFGFSHLVIGPQARRRAVRGRQADLGRLRRPGDLRRPRGRAASDAVQHRLRRLLRVDRARRPHRAPSRREAGHGQRHGGAIAAPGRPAARPAHHATRDRRHPDRRLQGLGAVRIGVPRESKIVEYRVGMVPDGVAALSAEGHDVCVEEGAGEGSGFADAEFARRGARLVSREEAWSADLVVKVKDPLPDEVGLLRAGATLFTYLHLAANRDLTRRLLDAGVIGIAYETIRNPDGSFPVLAPMSEVAGRLAVQIGVALLQKDRGGKGLLLGGVPGVMRGRVTVIGGGIVGVNAVRVAHALGAEVDVLDIDLRPAHLPLRHLPRRAQHAVREPREHRAVGGHERSRDRRRLPRGPARADAGLGEHGARDGRGLGDPRRRGRPGRLRGDDPSDHARGSHLRRARRDPLRRHQHARRGAAHLHLRAHQHHAAVRGEDRRARRRRGGGERRRARAGQQRVARCTRPPGRRRIARPSAHAARGASARGVIAGRQRVGSRAPGRPLLRNLYTAARSRLAARCRWIAC